MGRFTKEIFFNSILVLCLSIIVIIPSRSGLAAEQFDGNQKKFIYKQDDRPDPFIPLLSSKGLVKEMGPSTKEEMMNNIKLIKVSGIMWDDAQPIAMINKKMRKVGDVVEKLTIKKININGVVFGYHDQTHEIVLIKKKKMNDQGGIQ